MRKLVLTLTAAAALPLFGCAKSVDRAQHDVQRAHDRAVTNIERKQQDLQDTKQDAADRIAQKERRVEDTARKETDNIRQEEKELRDAVRAENQREQNRRDTITPDTTITPLPPE